MIGQDAVFGAVGHHPGTQVGCSVQGVDSVIQQLVGVLLLELLVKFLGDRLQHLGHGQGDPLRVIEIIIRHGPGNGLAVGFGVFDEVVVAAAQQVFVVAQQGDQVIHPGIEPGPAHL